MAWERRTGSGTYYYRSRRDAGGKVVKEYLGRGPQAAEAAAAIARNRAGREADQAALHDERARLAPLDGIVTVLIGEAQLIMDASLLAVGFRRQNHGAWRQRREHGHRQGGAARARGPH